MHTVLFLQDVIAAWGQTWVPWPEKWMKRMSPVLHDATTFLKAAFIAAPDTGAPGLSRTVVMFSARFVATKGDGDKFSAFLGYIGYK